MGDFRKPYRDLRDGEEFSTNAGRTWHVCAVPLFGNVAVYTTGQRGDDAPTIRIDVPTDGQVRIRPDAKDAASAKPTAEQRTCVDAVRTGLKTDPTTTARSQQPFSERIWDADYGRLIYLLEVEDGLEVTTDEGDEETTVVLDLHGVRKLRLALAQFERHRRRSDADEGGRS